MRDKEIIKALEYCTKGIGCSECAYLECHDFCCTKRNEDIVDLFHRLQAENERLKAEIERLKDYNENLQTANTHLSNTLLDEVKTAKAEARKEFAERLKKEALIDSGYEVLQLGTIDNLAKEMECE